MSDVFRFMVLVRWTRVVPLLVSEDDARKGIIAVFCGEIGYVLLFIFC